MKQTPHDDASVGPLTFFGILGVFLFFILILERLMNDNTVHQALPDRQTDTIVSGL